MHPAIVGMARRIISMSLPDMSDEESNPAIGTITWYISEKEIEEVASLLETAIEDVQAGRVAYFEYKGIRFALGRPETMPPRIT